MKRSLAAALALMALAGPAWAQGMVVPKEPLTGAQTAALNAIRDVRDSVVVASSLLAALQRDMAQKPAASLEEQARRITAQCDAAERQRVTSRKQLSEQKFTDKDMMAGQRDMLTSMDELRKPLTTCQSVWMPLTAAGKGEEVRGYGISRSKPIVAGFNAFERSVVNLAQELKLPVREVLRAGPSPADVPPAQLRPPPPRPS